MVKPALQAKPRVGLDHKGAKNSKVREGLQGFSDQSLWASAPSVSPLRGDPPLPKIAPAALGEELGPCPSAWSVVQSFLPQGSNRRAR
jgi:hypothetical protein